MHVENPGKEHRASRAYANVITKHPLAVLVVLLVALVLSVLAASRLTINSNQLDLISKDLREVKDVKRVIDMVGGAGYLMLGLRGTDEPQLKAVSDDIAAILTEDKENVRFITYKVPVEFIQKNMVLFIKTEDLEEGRRRINAYVRDVIRRASPFYIELRETKPVKLDLEDLIQKYGQVGKKSIRDDYYISKDRQMVLILIKPMWDTNELGKTKAYLDRLQGQIAEYSKKKPRGAGLVEDYARAPRKGVITYGFTGSYKTSVDDSYAMSESLEPVTILAFLLILVITAVFFRRVLPSVIVVSGMVVGTIISMGFAYVTIGQLNMITSILGGILMGFGVDYGIHFVFRTRIELGLGKRYDDAIRDALINAGRPAFVAAVVTAGSFLVLMVSEFQGFSQFGFLCCFGTLIIGLTLFSWCPAILMLIGNRWPDAPARLIGTTTLTGTRNEHGDLRIPRPGLVLGLCTLVVVAVCAFAVPWTQWEPPAEQSLSLLERLKTGIRFNYNTRALMPEDFYSVKLQDEVNDRFQISSDPIAVYTKTLEETKKVWDELTADRSKYPNIDQVVSIYSFVPPPAVAAENVKVLQAWKAELSDIEVDSLPEEHQDKAKKFLEILDVKPFDVHGVPEVYKKLFTHLPSAKPENHGYLTFIYPSVDLWDGKKMMAFADETVNINTKDGTVFHSAGLAILYAKLARIVLHDGQLTVLLTTLWILAMHFADFRNARLALASVVPLGVGLAMMLGLMSMLALRLNFMNIIVLPILLGFGVSHGLYLLHRFLEGTSPVVALRSVGAAVASSTLTAIAGFGSLLVANHNGLKSMGLVACLGLFTTLVVSFTVLAAVLQLLHDDRTAANKTPAPPAAKEGA